MDKTKIFICYLTVYFVVCGERARTRNIDKRFKKSHEKVKGREKKAMKHECIQKNKSKNYTEKSYSESNKIFTNSMLLKYL